MASSPQEGTRNCCNSSNITSHIHSIPAVLHMYLLFLLISIVVKLQIHNDSPIHQDASHAPTGAPS